MNKATIMILRLMMVFLLGTGLILLYGCGNNLAEEDIIYEYAGGGTPGDFYTFTINTTQNTYTFHNLITDDNGSGTYTQISPGFYQLDIGNNFIMIPGELVVSQVDVGDKPQLIVALRKTLIPYGVEIAGEYHWLDSYGNYGEADVTPDSNEPSEGNINGSVAGDTDNFIATYVFNNTYNAIEITESQASYREGHYNYGVFIEDEICVLDSYDESGEGLGISVGVKKLDSIDINDYAGSYSSLDKYGGNGTFTVNVSNNSIESIIYQGVDGSGNEVNPEISNITENSDGSIEFEITYGTSQETWTALLLPGEKIIVAASTESGNDGDNGNGGGNIIVGVEL